MKRSYSIGVDYGSNSVRAIVADCSNGRIIGTSVCNYPTGSQGIILDKKDHNLARQHPADYLTGLNATVTGALRQAQKVRGFSAEQVIGIGVDATSGTPLPVDKNNVPLALQPRFRKNPAAMAWLWKDHTSIDEAEKITALAKKMRPQYLARCGGSYSSEWFWSKVWHCKRTAPAVFKAAYGWMELTDYIPAVLAGVSDPLQTVRGVCAAGHKALYADEWGGYPDETFLKKLDPALVTVRRRMPEKAYAADTTAGILCAAWAKKLGLPAGLPIAAGIIDAHAGAVGSGCATGTLVKIIGTSSCDCAVVPARKKLKDIPGVSGVVKGSILPGYYGIEAGQAAVGDIFKWFVETVCSGSGSLHGELTKKARKLKPGQSGLLALDWNNGNRNTLADQRLSGLLVGQTLHTPREDIYRALIEGTAFGARAIIERIKEYGVPVKRIVCCGGIAEKNTMLMQIFADVTGCTMQVSASDQSCALGAAVAGAVVAGAKNGGYANFEGAQKKMTKVKPKQFKPNPADRKVYDRLYALYRKAYDAFGGVDTKADLSGVMKELISIRERQR